MKCYAPWHALTVRFNGDVVPCCVYLGRHGNLLTEELPDILESMGLKNTKTAIINNQFSEECGKCKQKEEMINHSRRKFFETTLNPLIPIYDYSTPVKDIYFLEFNMSNICNLKCRHCCGVNSSAWVKDDIKLSKMNQFYRPIDDIEFGYRNVPIKAIDNLFKYPEYFKNLQHVNLKGGEPYMEPANKIIMKYLIDNNLAKNITLDISTNGTIVDEEFDELAMQFKSTKWHISIEGVGELYNYIRGNENFNFEQLQSNLENFKKFDRVIFAGTVMTYNVCHLTEIQEWFEKIKQPNFELYMLNVVITPPYLNPCLLPNDLLLNTPYSHDPSLQNQLDYFIKYTRALDELRGTDILDVCPELSRFFS